MPALTLRTLTGEQGAREEGGPVEDWEDFWPTTCRPEQGRPPMPSVENRLSQGGLDKENHREKVSS